MRHLIFQLLLFAVPIALGSLLLSALIGVIVGLTSGRWLRWRRWNPGKNKVDEQTQRPVVNRRSS